MVGRLLAVAVVLLGGGLVLFAALDGEGSTVSSANTELAAQPSSPDEDPTPTTAAVTLAETPPNLGPRKGLVGLDGWINTDLESLDELDGQVVMVEMWTFGCRNCKNRIPHTQDLYATYASEGFEIVGVHAPEFDYESVVENIEAAVVDLGVTWPVALDTNKANFRAWQEGGRRFWPRTFVVDQNGDVRFDHIGEGAYDELEQTVAWLLANPPT
ncbi:MAG: redoxin domain-containing protein [Acidimicrobiales bacterium]